MIRGILAAWMLFLMTAALAAAPPPTAPWDTESDTWVGVDALGRPLPTAQEAGPPRPDKTLGMFYFLTFDRSEEGPYDNTKILAAHPEAMRDVHDPAWGPLNSSHYWGEPLFGYYVSDDEYVLRKHAQMLADAGVDVVIFDNSNAVTYDKARDTLCRVWEDIRHHGGKTPQIAFLCPFSNSNSIGSSTLAELYDTLYAPGRYSDLWFRWQGKPLILADPGYASVDGLRRPTDHQPAPLAKGGTLGQTFTAARPFDAVGGEFPTWATRTSGMTLSLRAGGPKGVVLTSRAFTDVADNATVLLETGKPLPAGRYCLEMSQPVGQIGWWGYHDDVYAGGQACEDGEGVGGDRALHVRYVGEAQAQALVHGVPPLTTEAAERRSQTIRDFFTFRTPIAPYNLTAPPPDSWAWLQIAPQAAQRDADGRVEQITVGVAQNYNATVNRTAPMSFPGAFGRSYHDGHLDTRPDAVDWGFNFGEQWQRARQVDPPFVFVTGWNEWTAGFYDDWAGFHAPPPIFVDEFTEEYSRDIEPMHGGHGDDYYYQLVSEVRRYKGVRPLPPATPAPIKLTGPFTAWAKVGPEYRDDIGDTVHRNAPGVGKVGRYVNTTGRNDIVAAKVSYDRQNLYFYVRTARPLTPHTDPDWMLLYLNTDGDYKTGWLGYDYVIDRRVGSATTSLEKNVGGQYRWSPVAPVHYRAQGNELMIAVPRSALGLTSLPAALDFKWADHCFARGDWTDFTLNGDAAPNDRFNYWVRFARTGH
jgi:hypothetical protein